MKILLFTILIFSNAFPWNFKKSVLDWGGGGGLWLGGSSKEDNFVILIFAEYQKSQFSLTWRKNPNTTTYHFLADFTSLPNLTLRRLFIHEFLQSMIDPLLLDFWCSISYPECILAHHLLHQFNKF